MSTIEVNQDTDVIVVNEDDAPSIVVILDSETEVVEVGEEGPPGPQGPQGNIGATGPQGIPGNTVLYGSIDPVAGVGVDGNFYINTTTHFMFGPKLSGIWPAGTSLIGPQGIQGIQGIQGVPGAAGVGAVHYDTAQTSLTASEREQGRKNIWAAPFDAMAYHGIQVNGGFEVSQEAAGVAQAVSTQPKYPVDMWAAVLSHPSASLTASQGTAAIPQSLGIRCLLLQATAAFSSPAAGNYGLISGNIEGYRSARLMYGAAGAMPMTLAFYVVATIPGTFTIALRNAATNRTYLIDVVINAALTWEFKTVTIPGDISGTWLYTSGVGMFFTICFGAGAGSTFFGSNNTWQAGNFWATSATTNFLATNGNQFGIAMFGIYPGNEAPPQARMPFLIRPFHEELRLCQRYWEKSYDYDTALGAVLFTGCGSTYLTVTNQTLVTNQLQVEKRVTPTIAVYSPSTGALGVAYHNGVGDITPTIDAIGTKGFRMYYSATGVANLYYHYTASAKVL